MCFIAVVFSFRDNPANKFTDAEVVKVKGMYVFIESTPAAENERVGFVKLSEFTFNDSYIAARNRLIEKSKSKYPDADGIIISTDTKNYIENADVIKFKK